MLEIQGRPLFALMTPTDVEAGRVFRNPFGRVTGIVLGIGLGAFGFFLFFIEDSTIGTVLLAMAQLGVGVVFLVWAVRACVVVTSKTVTVKKLRATTYSIDDVVGTSVHRVPTMGWKAAYLVLRDGRECRLPIGADSRGEEILRDLDDLIVRTGPLS